MQAELDARTRLRPPERNPATRTGFGKQKGQAVLTPKTEEELAEVIAGTTSPLHVSGGGTRPVGRVVNGDPLSAAKISGISIYEPGALTLVARAGTPLTEIETALEKEGQMLAFEPMDHRTLLGTKGTPTVGGVVAGNVSGPRRIQSGACRDFLLGVRFVDGAGSIIKNGGRVMKNVTGYDLTKLLAGSRGTLGVLTEVSLKVLPKPDTAAVLLLTGLSDELAVSAMSAALGSPYDVSGAAHSPQGLDGGPVTMVRVEGFETSVEYRTAQLKELLAQFGPAEIERRSGNDGGQGYEAGWRWIKDVEAFRDKSSVCRISLKPGASPKIVQALREKLAFDCLYDWGGGLLWIAADHNQLEQIATEHSGFDDLGKGDRGAAILHSRIQDRVGQAGGHATLVKASDAVRNTVSVFQPEAQPLARLAQGLRRQFDPKQILNPGLMD